MAVRADQLRRCLRLYLVTDPGLCPASELPARVRAAVDGGVTMVQLRDKDADTASRVRTASAIRAALKGTGVPLIVNDDPAAAIAAGADGVHIGQGDGDPVAVRRRIGPDRLLGLSCETPAHVASVADSGADHLGLGPVMATSTKPKHAAPLGFDGLAAMARATGLPKVAIGGLKAPHAGLVRDAGCDGMAVVSAILGAPDPRAAARDIIRNWREA
ncbi:thiamine phosphate synthase [Palleronia pelagia]|uniref:Thiamine-phosphate synthase n=1 Tax=Palleronia pelagia TaxID=387096 RepID=A0A1H8AZR8_9RHOB|nr:thiamine phosphate synthase [Palleronia pelagia]SEM75389.1 thiamine-phosphate pyrophosphorylase [Palleronia pelagia]